MTTPVVTNLAVAAGAKAFRELSLRVPCPSDSEFARAVLEAGGADIAAAERERIYDLLGRDHYVIFTEDRWTVEHSVDCRLSGRMPACEYHAAVVRIAGEFDPDMAGRWLITAIDPNGEPALVRDDLITAPAIPAEGTTP